MPPSLKEQEKEKQKKAEQQPIDARASAIAEEGLHTSSQHMRFREAVIQGLLAGRISGAIAAATNAHLSGMVKLKMLELQHGIPAGPKGLKALDFRGGNDGADG